jgi:hypothetical protein
MPGFKAALPGAGLAVTAMVDVACPRHRAAAGRRRQPIASRRGGDGNLKRFGVQALVVHTRLCVTGAVEPFGILNVSTEGNTLSPLGAFGAVRVPEPVNVSGKVVAVAVAVLAVIVPVKVPLAPSKMPVPPVIVPVTVVGSAGPLPNRNATDA